MATERQIAANRANAQKSTGPVTPEGKAKSAANSTRDALNAQICLMPDEDRAAHDAFCDELIADFAPATPFERQLAQTLAEDNWRLNRMKAIETTIFTVGLSTCTLDAPQDTADPHPALAQAQTFAADPKKFQLLTLYIQRTSREIHRNLQLLRELQTEREAARAAALKEAADLLALHQMKHPRSKHKFAANQPEGEPAQRGQTAGLIPAQPGQRSLHPVNGFVFSFPEIEAAMLRNRHLKQADLAATVKFDCGRYLKIGGSLA